MGTIDTQIASSAWIRHIPGLPLTVAIMAPDLETPSLRLKWAREQAAKKRPEFKSPRSAAEANAWNENTYRAHETRNNFDADQAKRYGRAYKVNWVWLLLGLGEPKGKPSELDADQADYFDRDEIRNADLVTVREIDLYAGAGGGGQMPESYRRLDDGSWEPTDAVKAHAMFPRSWLSLLGLDPNYTDLVRVKGDSMSPEIEDGDWVFVDRRAHRLTGDDIYLLWDGFGIVAKSLAVVRSSRPIKVRILSANPKYPPDEVPIEDIMLIGRVQFRIGRIVRR